MKTILNNIKFQYFIVALTALYMGIETQSLLMVWDITNHAPSAELMERYERFGYAASGLGITLLAARLLLRAKLNSLLVLFLVPIIYFTSVWSVYEAVSRAPELIPQNKKPQALASSLSIVTRPDVTSMFSFYIDQNVDKEGLATAFNERHPMPARAIQATYLNGLTSVKLITQLFNGSWKQLDKSIYDQVVKGSDFALGFESHKANNMGVAVTELRSMNNLLEKASPLNYLFLANPEYIRSLLERQASHELQAKTLIAITYDMLPFGNAPVEGDGMVRRWNPAKYRMNLNSEAVELANQKYWDMFRENLTFLNEKAPILDGWDIDWDLAIRKQFTEHVFSKHIGGAEVSVLRWYDATEDYSKNETYLAMLNHATPFFFDKNGEPLLSFRELVNPGVSEKMRNALRMGLNDSLQSHYDQYRESSLDSLMDSAKKWENFTDNATFSPLLRIGVILPVLFLLSIALIVANAVSLSKSSLLALGAGVMSSVVVICIQGTPGSEFLTDLMLHISVQKPAITLF